MRRETDITKIALSREEIRKLRWISKHEPVQEQDIECDPLSLRLYKRDMIERCCSDRFPYVPASGTVEIPHNAFRLTDAGWQFLNRRQEQDSERRFTKVLAIWGAVTGTAAIIVEIWLHFL